MLHVGMVKVCVLGTYEYAEKAKYCWVLNEGEKFTAHGYRGFLESTFLANAVVDEDGPSKSSDGVGSTIRGIVIDGSGAEARDRFSKQMENSSIAILI